jgi:hypothetical protein
MYRPVLSGVVIPHGEPGIEEKKKQILFEEYKEEREKKNRFILISTKEPPSFTANVT